MRNGRSKNLLNANLPEQSFPRSQGTNRNKGIESIEDKERVDAGSYRLAMTSWLLELIQPEMVIRNIFVRRISASAVSHSAIFN